MAGNRFFGRAAPVSSPTPARTEAPSPYQAEALTPRIKHTGFLKALQAHGVPPEQMPVSQALCGELLVTYAFDLPDQFVMATPPLLAQAGLQASVLMALAQQNMKGKLSAQLLKTASPGLITVRTGELMEAVMLVFDSFWDGHVGATLGGGFVVAAPRRDVVLIADLAVDEAVETLREQAMQVLVGGDDAHGLSAQLMHRVDGQWVLHEQT